MAPGSTAQAARRRLHATALHLQAAVALPSTAESFPNSHEPIKAPVDTPYFFENKFLPSQATQWIDLHDPATNNLVTRVPQSTDAELKAAVQAAAIG